MFALLSITIKFAHANHQNSSLHRPIPTLSIHVLNRNEYNILETSDSITNSTRSNRSLLYYNVNNGCPVPILSFQIIRLIEIFMK